MSAQPQPKTYAYSNDAFSLQTLYQNQSHYQTLELIRTNH